jgi:hypothetical protein
LLDTNLPPSPVRFLLDNLRAGWYLIGTGKWIGFLVLFSGTDHTGVVNMKQTVRTVEEEQNSPVAKKEYGKPQLTVYEDLKTVTGNGKS